MKVEVLVPAQSLGDVISDLNSRRTRIDSIETSEDPCVIRCFIPLAKTFGLIGDLRSLSQGRATYTMEFYRYEELPPSLTGQIVDSAR